MNKKISITTGFFSLVAIMSLLFMFSSCSEDKYSLRESNITQDSFTFTATPGSDEWTYDFAIAFAATPNTVYSAQIVFGDGKSTKGVLTATHEYIALAGASFTPTCIVTIPDGSTFIKELPAITIKNDNPKALVDDPKSLQYALTGGKENTAGKEWHIGPWTAMRDPNNRDNVWWDFKNAALLNDIFTFIPNGVETNGKFIYENNGDTHMNESLGSLFADGSTTGSFVTTLFTPPTDATWDISDIGGKTILTIYKGFLGYAFAPSNLEKTQYEILSFSPASIKLVNYDANPSAQIWAWELTSTVAEDPLTGTGSKTWVIDANNSVAKEVAAATGLNIAGFMGLGPLNSLSQSWWAAGPQEKSYDNTLASVGHGWTLFDWKMTFSPGKLNIETAGEGYGRAALDGTSFNSIWKNKDDMAFPFTGGDFTYTIASGDPYKTMTLSGNAFFGYYVGTQDYQILYLSPTALCVAAHNTVEGQDWVFILTPEGGVTPPPPPPVEGNWVDVNSADNLWHGVSFTNTFYYAPGWTQLPNPELTIDGTQYSVSFPTATSSQWQSQVAFVTDNVSTTAADNYDFRVVLNASNDIKQATVKLTQAVNSDNDAVYIFTQRVDLTAGKDVPVELVNMPGKDMDPVKLVFDFGGNPDNTDVVIKDVILQKHR